MTQENKKKGFGEFGKDFKPVINSPSPVKRDLINDEFEPREKRVQAMLTQKEYIRLINLAGKGNVSSYVRDVIIAAINMKR